MGSVAIAIIPSRIENRNPGRDDCRSRIAAVTVRPDYRLPFDQPTKRRILSHSIQRTIFLSSSTKGKKTYRLKQSNFTKLSDISQKISQNYLTFCNFFSDGFSVIGGAEILIFGQITCWGIFDFINMLLGLF